ncbi:MAG: PhoH family protein [Phycisphaerae bacterium]
MITLDIEPRHKLALFGPADRNLKLLRQLMGVQIFAAGDHLKISGETKAVERCVAVVAELRRNLPRNGSLTVDDVGRVASRFASDSTIAGVLDVAISGQGVTPRTPGQTAYVAAMEKSDLVFCAGPAGTGKTFLAVALAVTMLRRGLIRRLVLVRPAVEAGEKLGFLPGDIQAKVNPYLRPLLDALHDMMPYEQIRRLMANDVIELAPLAYMRGRTLNDAMIILDEAQNTTPSQMLMFLTRLGQNSKMVITGDPTQVDLDEDQISGLVDARRKLRGIRGIDFVELGRGDIVRHPLVQNVVEAYNRQDNNLPR